MMKNNLTDCPYNKKEFDEENCFNIVNFSGCGGLCNHELLWDSQREVLKETLLDQMDFRRFGFETSQKEGDGNDIAITMHFQKDLYRNDLNTIMVGHHTRSLDDIKKFLRGVNSFYDVGYTYRGFDTILFKLKDKKYIFCIAKELMDEVESLINELSVNLKSNIVTVKVGIHERSERSDSLLYVATPWFWIIRSGVFVDRFEEEQMKLSQKVKESRQFFKVVEFFDVDWRQLKDDKDQSFQDLTYDLLNLRQSTIKIQAIGKSKAPDRGRDFIYFEKIDTIEGESEFKWLIQCKYSNGSISPSSIYGWTDRIIEHHVDGYWLITNNDITQSLYDQFKDVEANPKYKNKIKTNYWERLKIGTLLNVYPEIYKKYFKNS